MHPSIEMELPDLQQARISSGAVAALIDRSDPAGASRLATEHLSSALCDLGLTLEARGKLSEAVKYLQDGLNVCPANEAAFHNLAGTLLSHRMLRAENLDSLARFVQANRNRFPWVAKYDGILVSPRFLNLEFVAGKCNLKCRMCGGTNAPSHPNRLSYLTAEDLDRLLEAMPTVGGLTLSSGDSDPLMHPEWERVMAVAVKHRVGLDVFTNGHPLSERMCRQMIASQVVNMLNFSIDAATPETYQRIRGAPLDRLLRKIEMLLAMKRDAKALRPFLSFSFVAMADNIEELPAFVRLARRMQGYRVFVEYLSGWEGGAGGNHEAKENPRWAEAVREAQREAEGESFALILPPQLAVSASARPRPVAVGEPGTAHGEAKPATLPSQDEPAALSDETSPEQQLPWCSWLRGAWVNMDGSLDPCCMIHGVVDMGSIHDGPLMENKKWLRVKGLLREGKVLDACQGASNCLYVQQQRVAGKRLRIMTREELGPVHLDAHRSGGHVISLPVLEASVA